MGSKEDAFLYALTSNESWANYKRHQNPQFFPKLAAGQSPSILWLGCSDSRVPETTILGQQPGDVFVHRNIANVITPSDLSSLSVIEYAVVHLKVSHIVLCGHSCCGGAAAALGDSRVGGVLDAWLGPLKAVRTANETELNGIKDAGKRAIRLAELNVQAGVETLMSNYVVVEAIKERGLEVHGTLFEIGSGRIRDLGFGTSAKFGGAKKSMVNGMDGAEEEGKIVRGNHGMLVFREGGAAMTVQ